MVTVDHEKARASSTFARVFSSGKRLLPDEEREDDGERGQAGREPERFLRRVLVRATDQCADFWAKLVNITQRFAHAFDDLKRCGLW